MRDQYRYVGPVLLVLNTMPEEAALCRWYGSGEPVDPKEVWIDVLHTWVRLSGEWLSGWDDDTHFGFRPNWLNRWKIRRAGKRWLNRQSRNNLANNLSDTTGYSFPRPVDSCPGGVPTFATGAFRDSSFHPQPISAEAQRDHV